MLDDLRFALRLFARNRGAAAVAIISLAVAIGPNVALFSVVDRLILKRSAIQGTGQLFDVWLRTDRPGQSLGLSYPDLLDYQAQAGDVATVAATETKGAVLNFAGQREIPFMCQVSENYFSVLGATAAVGRTLLDSDAHFEGPPPAVISYSLWQRHYQGSSDVLGEPLCERPSIYHCGRDAARFPRARSGTLPRRPVDTIQRPSTRRTAGLNAARQRWHYCFGPLAARRR